MPQFEIRVALEVSEQETGRYRRMSDPVAERDITLSGSLAADAAVREALAATITTALDELLAEAHDAVAAKRAEEEARRAAQAAAPAADVPTAESVEAMPF